MVTKGFRTDRGWLPSCGRCDGSTARAGDVRNRRRRAGGLTTPSAENRSGWVREVLRMAAENSLVISDRCALPAAGERQRYPIHPESATVFVRALGRDLLRAAVRTDAERPCARYGFLEPVDRGANPLETS